MSESPAPQRPSWPITELDEPSTFFALWPEGDAPLEEEVRLALKARWPGTRQIDDLEPEPEAEILWGGVHRIPEEFEERGDYMIWAEPRGDLSNDFVASVLQEGEERDQALKTRWILGVECLLDSARAQQSFQGQMRVIQEAVVAGPCPVYDENAMFLRSSALVNDLCLCPVPPRASALYELHSIGGRGGFWIHTHGLDRAGVHELDLIGIPPDMAPECDDLLDAVADALIGGHFPNDDGILEVGEGLKVCLASLEEALAVYPADYAGGLNDREGDISDDRRRRLVLLDASRKGPPIRLLSKVAGDSTVYKTRGETLRQQNLSRARYGTFGQLFAIAKDEDWKFCVKLAFDQAHGEGAREHLWFEALELRPDFVRGRLINQPCDVPQLSRNDESWVSLDRLTDWLIVTPEGNFDPEHAEALLE